MNAIFSVDQNWAIGYQNQLLFRAKGDMENLRRLTLGKVIIMGYHTLLSLPGGRPLPKRENVVLSRRPGLQVAGATVCSGLPELFEWLGRYPGENLFVFGGEAVYRQLLPYCDRAYVTKFHAIAPQTDSYLPNLDIEPIWTVEHAGELLEEDGLAYQFFTYRNLSPHPWREG